MRGAWRVGDGREGEESLFPSEKSNHAHHSFVQGNNMLLCQIQGKAKTQNRIITATFISRSFEFEA